ncbi:MAG: selenium cofactor biosynthesis protein YqeC [Faecalibacillus sp.]
MIKAVIGSGGKTTLIKQMADEYVKQGYKVFVTTSTHMYKEKGTLIDFDIDHMIHELEYHHYLMAGKEEGEKIRSLSLSDYMKICQHADVVLIEADGSKNMPLKFPNQNEPVIYDNVDEIIVVSSLLALGKKAKDVIFRLSLAQQYCNIQDDDIIEAKHIQLLLKKGYLEPLTKNNPDKKITIHINHDHSLYQRTLAKLLEGHQDVNLINQKWFSCKKTLMICGGGHVAYELAKMASQLDFYIKVMDDRKEFANKERYDFVDEVICDSFDHLERYLIKDAYYVVVTRGHKDDYECVKTILNHSYEYLGMIGSKIKVNQIFEKLRNDRLAEDKIQTIHAPIGLNIQAQTPAEIAVSILAQMILEKNKRCSSSISQKLMNYQGKGVLCIIIDKTGSSPRGIGSMMLVHDNQIIDSIGGGAIENEVIQKARTIHDIEIVKYHLDNKDSEKLGMICGGSNTILFIPL